MKVTSANIKKWSMLGQRGTIFGVALPAIAERKENLKLLTADLSLLSGMNRFAEQYPEKFLNVGIAEQNMIGIAAGLAMSGKTVFASTYASFIAVRSLEHVRQHLSYLECDVKLIGSSGGVVAAKSGVSHWATEDLAFTRVLPNVEVFSPADSLEAYKVAEYAADSGKPTYIRLSGALNCPIVYREDYGFVPGKIIPIYSTEIEADEKSTESKIDKKSKHISVIATGLMVARSVDAIKRIEKDIETGAISGGYSISVYNMPTIKPIDAKGLDRIFEESDLVITVEEHNILGGMGSAVAEYKATKANTPRQVFIGFKDSFYPAGTQDFVLEEAGLSSDGVADRIIEEIKVL